MKIIELKIDENDERTGWDAIALVEHPAIEQDFHAFSKHQFETYNDYPEAAVEAAKMGIKRNEELGNPCATQVGKVRAQQLANRESLSIDTIKRMRSFLTRQKDNYDLAVSRKDYEACGYISYLLWGGPAALPWAEKKLRQAGYEFEKDSKGDNVFLISCSAEKKDHKCAAQELYDSPLFKKSLEFSRKKAKSDNFIKIISAKLYLVDLDQVIEPYDLTLKNMSSDEQKAWASKTYEMIKNKFNINKDKFVFLAGSAYTKYLLPMFKYKSDFLEGKRLGERMQYLDTFSEAQYFVVATNNIEHAKQHNFTLVDVERDLEEELECTCEKTEMSKHKPGLVHPNCDCEVVKGEFRTKGTSCPICSQARRDWNTKGQFKTVFGQIFDKNIFGPNASIGPAQFSKLTEDYIAEQLIMQVFGQDYVDLTTTSTETPPHATLNKFAQELQEKQMIIAPIMRANYLIPRVDEDGNEYQVYFSAETIKQIAYKAMKEGKIHNINLEHNPAWMIDDVYMVETWLVEDAETDKATLYGFEPQVGDWYSMFKIDNETIWNDVVKTGMVKGVSIEGYFTEKLIK